MGLFRFTIYRGRHVIEMGWCEASSKATGTYIPYNPCYFSPSDLNQPARPYDLGSIVSQKSPTIWELSVQTREPVELI